MRRRIHDVKLIDIVQGLKFGIIHSIDHLVNSYIIIPFGIICIFATLYGLNELIKVWDIKFPASVLGMLINLVFLVLLSAFSEYKVPAIVLRNYLRIIKPPMNFSLKWINVFFIPSFVILPLSSHITIIEVLKIAGVFVGGWIALMIIDVYFIMALRLVLPRFLYNSTPKNQSDSLELSAVDLAHSDDITTIDLDSLAPIDDKNNVTNLHLVGNNQNPFIHGNSSKFHQNHERSSGSDPILKRNISENEVERSVANPSKSTGRGLDDSKIISGRASSSTETFKEKPKSDALEKTKSLSGSIDEQSKSNNFKPPSVAEPEPLYHKPGNLFVLKLLSTFNSAPATQQEVNPFDGLNEATKTIATFVIRYIDWVLYFILFIVSLPLYYTSLHIFLPYHLSVTILAYYLALLIPQNFPSSKKYAHPILISTGEILFVFFIGSLIYHHGKPYGFLQDLEFYKTGKNYLNLFNNQIMLNNGKEFKLPSPNFTATPQWPGCGDFLSSLMDVSIVALSLPMFTHRKDFVKNFWVLMPTILVSIAATFLLYPLVCHAIRIEPERSIGFIGRSVTLALGTPLIGALGGSVSLMAVCTILSGISGVLIGDTVFKILRVKPDDFVTRGTSLGINCGAIATAHLLNTDPRAAAMSSLSFSIFGTVMIIMASVNTVSGFIKTLGGL